MLDITSIVAGLTGDDPVTNLIRSVDRRIFGSTDRSGWCHPDCYLSVHLGRIPTEADSRAKEFPPLKWVQLDLKRAAYLVALWTLRHHSRIRREQEGKQLPNFGDDGSTIVDALTLLVARARTNSFNLNAERAGEKPVSLMMKVPDGLNAVCHIGASVNLNDLLPPWLLHALCVYAVADLSEFFGCRSPLPISVSHLDQSQLPRFSEELLRTGTRNHGRKIAVTMTNARGNCIPGINDRRRPLT